MAHSVTQYHDAAGVLHAIRLEEAPGGRWRMLDVGPHGAALVEELSGPNDGQPQAEALARDYAAQAQLATRGATEDEHEKTWAA
jgi:hypothetical protein